MLYLDVNKIMSDRGIDYPTAFLQNHGFTAAMASKLSHNKIMGTNWRNIEKLCLALHCGPTELFSWRPDEGQAVAANHPLYKLVVTEDAGKLGSQLRTLSPEKLEEVKRLVKELSR